MLFTAQFWTFASLAVILLVLLITAVLMGYEGACALRGWLQPFSGLCAVLALAAVFGLLLVSQSRAGDALWVALGVAVGIMVLIAMRVMEDDGVMS